MAGSISTGERPGKGKPLTGQVAVVTGASAGVGEAISKQLAKAGARVVMGARRIEKLEKIKTTIEKNGGHAAFKKTDVTVRQEVQDLVTFAETTFGDVDIFVNNAAVFSYILMKNLQVEEWDKMVDVNCKGLLNGISAVLDSMIKRKTGHIVTISSITGKTTYPGITVYAGTKFFAEGVCRGLRREVSAYNIRVTAIQPGAVDTDMFKDGYTDKAAVETYGRIDNSQTKILEPLDVANAVLYAVTQPSHVAVNELLIQPHELKWALY